jgi:hemolysin III
MDVVHFREPVSAGTHFLWMVLSLPGTLVLWRLSRGDVLKRVGVLVFGASLVSCYAGSWLYHSVPKGMEGPFNTFDHIGIYLLIAGTVTPIALVVLSGWRRVGLLGLIWGIAALGITLRLTTHMTILQMTVLYVFMGWVGCTMYFELARRLSARKVKPLILGGIFYTVGAIINGAHWPLPSPSPFGYHELFHLFVMTGTLYHYYFMMRAVLPYQALPAVVPCPVPIPVPVLSTSGDVRR